MRPLTLTALLLSCSALCAKEQPYRPPRLEDGQPDLQGVWIAVNATPLQRPPGFNTLAISEAQSQQLLAAIEARAENRAAPGEPTEYFEALQLEPIRGELRSSIIVDPPNGVLPGNDLFKTQLAKALAAVISATDGVEQRPAAERCLGSQTTQPPILSIRNGVNLHQIVQTKDAFVFSSEFVSATRIIRLNSYPLPAVLTSWLGDSVGHWQADTLIVQTRGFTPSDHLRQGPNGSFLVSPLTVVTERFVRVAHDQIDYSFTVEDPTYYTQPWTGESHFRRRDESILEYACHEANYSLRYILEAARLRDGEGAL
jgi:hypothetical protein